MIGRPACGMQADDGIDEAALVQHPADRTRVFAAARNGDGAFGGGNSQGVAQIVMRVDESGAGKMQPHHLHQHLVGIGGAVECAGAGPVIGGNLGFQQIGTGGLAAGERFADRGLFGIRQTTCHRPSWHKNHRKMAKGQRPDHQPRHDLVANAQAKGGVIDPVRQPDRRCHGDDIAAHQRQLHARPPLGDAIAHCRHAASHLCSAACGPRGGADHLRIVFKRLVRRQHVVIGGDDADIRCQFVACSQHICLVGAGCRGGMCHVGTGYGAPVAVGRFLHRRDIFEIGLPLIVAAVANPFGDGCDAVVKLCHSPAPVPSVVIRVDPGPAIGGKKVVRRPHRARTIERRGSARHQFQCRIDDVPGCEHLVAAHEQRLVAASGIHQQSFIGIGQPCLESVAEAEVEFRGEQPHAARAGLLGNQL